MFRSVSPSSPTRRLRSRSAALALAVSAAALVPATASATDAKPVTPVPSLELTRYLGDWKQIAAIPQWYEAACQSNVTANYKPTSDGGVAVANRCNGPFGAQILSKGKARVLDKTTGAKLQVSFVNAFGNWFYPDAKPNYIVAGLGANYDWAVVGDPDRSSGFVLSRTASLTTEQKTAALAVLDANGYDACKLKVTKQTGGATKVVPFCQL